MEDNKSKIVKPIIDHTVIKEAIENNWFETNPSISDDEVSQMAIGIAGEVDDFIRERQRNLMRQIQWLKDMIPRRFMIDINQTIDEAFEDYIN